MDEKAEITPDLQALQPEIRFRASLRKFLSVSRHVTFGVVWVAGILVAQRAPANAHSLICKSPFQRATTLTAPRTAAFENTSLLRATLCTTRRELVSASFRAQCLNQGERRRAGETYASSLHSSRVTWDGNKSRFESSLSILRGLLPSRMLEKAIFKQTPWAFHVARTNHIMNLRWLRAYLARSFCSFFAVSLLEHDWANASAVQSPKSRQRVGTWTHRIGIVVAAMIFHTMGVPSVNDPSAPFGSYATPIELRGGSSFPPVVVASIDAEVTAAEFTMDETNLLAYDPSRDISREVTRDLAMAKSSIRERRRISPESLSQGQSRIETVEDTRTVKTSLADSPAAAVDPESCATDHDSSAFRSADHSKTTRAKVVTGLGKGIVIASCFASTVVAQNIRIAARNDRNTKTQNVTEIIVELSPSTDEDVPTDSNPTDSLAENARNAGSIKATSDGNQDELSEQTLSDRTQASSEFHSHSINSTREDVHDTPDQSSDVSPVHFEKSIKGPGVEIVVQAGDVVVSVDNSKTYTHAQEKSKANVSSLAVSRQGAKTSTMSSTREFSFSTATENRPSVALEPLGPRPLLDAPPLEVVGRTESLQSSFVRELEWSSSRFEVQGIPGLVSAQEKEVAESAPIQDKESIVSEQIHPEDAKLGDAALITDYDHIQGALLDEIESPTDVLELEKLPQEAAPALPVSTPAEEISFPRALQEHRHRKLEAAQIHHQQLLELNEQKKQKRLDEIEHLQALRHSRQQPLPPEVEEALAKRYAAIPSLGERAFQILLDLGMIEEHLPTDS
jgi:hypothetical protein